MDLEVIDKIDIKKIRFDRDKFFLSLKIIRDMARKALSEDGFYANLELVLKESDNPLWLIYSGLSATLSAIEQSATVTIEIYETENN